MDAAAARAAMLPSVRLICDVLLRNRDWTELLTPASLAADLIAGLSAPIFDGGRLEAQQVGLAEARSGPSSSRRTRCGRRAWRDSTRPLGSSKRSAAAGKTRGIQCS